MSISRNRGRTAYRKSRKFGDIYGGRLRTRLTDGIFRRYHSLKPPGPNDQTPILMQDNPSRDFFFPLSVQEASEALRALPKKHYRGITHLWNRRARGRDLANRNFPLAEFICGSGVRLIVLYPWRRDLKLDLGARRPKHGLRRTYEEFGAEIVGSRGRWQAEFSLKDLRRFYIEYLLYHEVGHHVDWYRRQWSAANLRQLEEAADQYAVRWSRTAKYVLNRLEKERDEGAS